MRSLKVLTLLCSLSCLALSSPGQEDISRDNRLPSRIGGRTCNTGARATATVAGSLNVQGLKEGKAPLFTVSIYAGGSFIGRQKVKNGGSFNFYCVPNENVTLVAEADSVEIASFPMGMLNSPPLSNRQDMVVTLANGDSPDQKDKTRVISAQNAYERTKENQKLFERATGELQKKKSDEAIKTLKQLVDNDPNDFVAWLIIGDIHFNEGRFGESESAYETSLKLKTDSLSAMVGVGRSALNTKNFARSIEVLSSALTLRPDLADANHYIGEAYLQTRKGSLAIAHMNKAIELDPARKADLHLRLAALYNAAKAPHLAANEYKLFLEKRPNHPDKQRMEQYITENSQ
jgi:predicted Zn-dependent protease